MATLTISDALLDRIAKVAQVNKRSVSDQVNILLENALYGQPRSPWTNLGPPIPLLKPCTGQEIIDAIREGRDTPP